MGAEGLRLGPEVIEKGLVSGRDTSGHLVQVEENKMSTSLSGSGQSTNRHLRDTRTRLGPEVCSGGLGVRRRFPDPTPEAYTLVGGGTRHRLRDCQTYPSVLSQDQLNEKRETSSDSGQNQTHDPPQFGRKGPPLWSLDVGFPPP